MDYDVPIPEASMQATPFTGDTSNLYPKPEGGWEAMDPAGLEPVLSRY